MAPLGVSMKRLEQLSFKLIIPTGEDTDAVNSRSKVVEKLRKLLPPEVMIPERRLEYLLEDILDRQLMICKFHNVPDSDLSLCCDHHCRRDKIPSVNPTDIGGT
ncbi:putative WD repeat-containing protein 26 [Cardamine amara subsp. amara]|uniref:WD repeat-containing protein 26 n=1 Tax=Cardamine amara subsp. amara TaxID=228776 RepID=A0ABD1AAA7_CARAN